ETAFSIVRVVSRNVKRWRPGNQIKRWAGSYPVNAQKQLTRSLGYHPLPGLLAALESEFKQPDATTRNAGRMLIGTGDTPRISMGKRTSSLLGVPSSLFAVVWPSVRENFQLSQASASIFLTLQFRGFVTSGLIGRIESMLGAKGALTVATGAIAFDLV